MKKEIFVKVGYRFDAAQQQFKLTLTPNKVYKNLVNFVILKLETFIHINDFLYPIL